MDSFFLNRAVFSIVTWQPIFCETDEFVMRKSGGFMGFETAVLYRKYGLRELELHRYLLAQSLSMVNIPMERADAAKERLSTR